MRSLCTLALAALSLFCIAAGPDDGPDMSAVFPTGEPDAQPIRGAVPQALAVGIVAYPASPTAISCMDPAMLESILHQVSKQPSTPELESYLVGDHCSMNGTDLGWRIIAIRGRLAQTELEAAPSLVMWFDLADLTDRATAMPASATSPAP